MSTSVNTEFIPMNYLIDATTYSVIHGVYSHNDLSLFFMYLFFKSYRKYKGELQTIITIILVWVFCPCIYVLGRSFIASYGCELLSSSILWFQPEGLPQHFLQLRSNGFKVSQFCLSGNILIFPTFLKASFARYSIFSWQSFSLSILCISSHCIQGLC